MRLSWLHELTEQDGPFATVVMDATREGAQGVQQAELRWRAHADRLHELGCPEPVVDELAAVATGPAARPGQVGRLLVGTPDELALDLTLPAPPVREHTAWSVVPSLLPAVRAFAESASYLLVELDSAGADLTLVGGRGRLPRDEQPVVEHVEGSHDVLHAPRTGLMSQRRVETRVEDSVLHNAVEVAVEVAAVVRRHHPDLVLLSGSGRSVAEFLEHSPPAVTDRAHVLGSAGRAAGTSGEALAHEVEQVVVAHRAETRGRLLDRFAAAHARQREAANGLDEVVTALQQGQVDELLLHDDPTSDLTMAATGRPEQLSRGRDDLLAMGVEPDAVHDVRADAALVWALVGTDASITLLDPDEEPDLADGVGAVLRWADGSTPHDLAPSMPGHGEPPG